MPGMDAYDFILDNIDSVPHLEALILLWNSRPVGWTVEELSTRLYLPAEKVNDLLRDLLRIHIAREIPASPTKYTYNQRSDEQDELMHQIDTVYRRDLVRISTLIHTNASSPVREFARAFKLKKESNS